MPFFSGHLRKSIGRLSRLPCTCSCTSLSPVGRMSLHACLLLVHRLHSCSSGNYCAKSWFFRSRGTWAPCDLTDRNTSVSPAGRPFLFVLRWWPIPLCCWNTCPPREYLFVPHREHSSICHRYTLLHLPLRCEFIDMLISQLHFHYRFCIHVSSYVPLPVTLTISARECLKKDCDIFGIRLLTS